jgi:hypothetical protein
MLDRIPSHAAPDPWPGRVAPTPAAAELRQLLLATEGITDLLDRLVTLAAEALPDGTSCAIALSGDHGATTAASSDDRAAQVDEVQYRHHDGPCPECLASGREVVVDDLADDDRWPGYRLPALGHGVRSSLSLPLCVRDSVVGALNAYASAPGAFGPAERLVARRVADEASRALELTLHVGERGATSTQLQEALGSRAVIDQAVGVVMGRDRCPADEAFEALDDLARRRGVELREVAAEVVASVGGAFPTDPPACPEPGFPGADTGCGRGHRCAILGASEALRARQACGEPSLIRHYRGPFRRGAGWVVFRVRSHLLRWRTRVRAGGPLGGGELGGGRAPAAAADHRGHRRLPRPARRAHGQGAPR